MSDTELTFRVLAGLIEAVTVIGEDIDRMRGGLPGLTPTAGEVAAELHYREPGREAWDMTDLRALVAKRLTEFGK